MTLFGAALIALSLLACLIIGLVADLNGDKMTDKKYHDDYNKMLRVELADHYHHG